jgi:hypothetical protein
MLSDYIAALLALQRTRDLARSALPDAPVQPDIERGKIDQDRRANVPLRPADRVACPCGRWELSRYDRVLEGAQASGRVFRLSNGHHQPDGAVRPGVRLVAHALSYSNPEELRVRVIALAKVAGWPP